MSDSRWGGATMCGCSRWSCSTASPTSAAPPLLRTTQPPPLCPRHGPYRALWGRTWADICSFVELDPVGVETGTGNDASADSRSGRQTCQPMAGRERMPPSCHHSTPARLPLLLLLLLSTASSGPSTAAADSSSSSSSPSLLLFSPSLGYPLSPPSLPPSTHTAFLSWLASRGVDTSAFSIASLPNGERGVVATKRIPAFARHLQVPRSLILSAAVARSSPFMVTGLRDALATQIDDDCLAVALFLAHERHRPLSAWRPVRSLKPTVPQRQYCLAAFASVLGPHTHSLRSRSALAPFSLLTSSSLAPLSLLTRSAAPLAVPGRAAPQRR